MLARPFVALVAVVLTSALALAQDVRVFHGPRAAPGLGAEMLVPNEFIVRLDPAIVPVIDALQRVGIDSTGISSLDELAGRFNVSEHRKQFPGAAEHAAQQGGRLPDLSGYYLISFDTTRGTLERVMNAYRADPLVQHVEPIGIHPVSIVPNDNWFSSQWHLHQANDKDMDAPEAWDIHTGSANVIVAVLDTGVRYYHKDLGGSGTSPSNITATSGNIWRNPGEILGNGIDDDGNGYVDDWVGWDFVTGVTNCWSGEDCSTADNDPRDFNGHGTHCAGNVGAINNNGSGTASPAGGWLNGSPQSAGNGVKVMCLRIGWSGQQFGQEVGFVRMDFAASALYYAANKGARIASCSWGSSNSGGIAAAIDYFLASGGLIFKAAGNSNNQSADYMCGRSDIYCVAATDQNDKKASFSTYGTWVDISAPGVAIWSSYHHHPDPNNDYVAALDGTSMATPLVASAAALVWSKNPTWTKSQVWTQLRDTADNIDALNPSFLGKLGSGRVNLHTALGGGAPPPPEVEICDDGIDNDGDGLIDCADPDCSAAPNCASPPPPPPSVGVFVDCATYTLHGGNKHLRVTIKVVNDSNAAVSGAGVSISLSGNNTYTASGTTGTNGEVTFTLNNAANTCWTTTVTNVTAAGLTWDGQTPPNGFRKGTDPVPNADCRSGNTPCG